MHASSIDNRDGLVVSGASVKIFEQG
ncbi:hypothetical protein [Bradyrhizobium sp. USDA 4350]